MAWGHHLTMQLSRCAAARIRCPHNIELFSRRLVREIDMVAFGSPIVARFASGNKAGYTLVQLIETSNICAHFCEESNDAYLDVFSCKPFDPRTVRRVAAAHFNFEASSYRLVKRDASILR